MIEGLTKMIDKQEFNKSEFKMIKAALKSTSKRKNIQDLKLLMKT